MDTHLSQLIVVDLHGKAFTPPLEDIGLKSLAVL
jgi:hypothetical protein